MAVVDTEPLVDMLQDSRRVIQFLGGCGYGKTTHLLAVRRAFLRQAPFAPTGQEHSAASPPELIYFPEKGPRPRLVASRPLFIDEAQRMSWWQRQQLLRRPGPLVITSHTDYSQQFRRRGWKVSSVNVQRPKTASEVACILNRRIDASRIDDRHPAVTEEFCQLLLDRFGYNMRCIEEQLYESVQSCVRENRAWPPAI